MVDTTVMGETAAGGRRAISRRSFLAAGAGLAGAALLDSACGSSSSSSSAGHDLGAVDHVVFLMQENRSFDHYFGSYRGVRGFDDRPANGLGNFAQPWPAGPDSTLLPFNLSNAAAQLCSGNASVPIHDWTPQHASRANGTNDEFVSVHSESANDGKTQGPMVMGYFTRKQLEFYYALADTYTICDNYFCSVLGPTMPNRLYFMSGFLDPAGTHGGPILETPGFSEAAKAVGSVSWDTMPEVLQDKGVSWKIYQPPGTSVGSSIGSSLAIGFNVMLYFSQAVKNPKSALYQNAFLPSWPDQLAADVKSGTLPAVSWILPPVAYSEHPNGSPLSGQWFTSQILQTLQSNPKVWEKTVVILNYDENGGFFDHVVPPTPPAGTPGEFITAAGTENGTPVGLGFRVPMMVISPFSAGGWVDSTRYDHTSALRLLETRFDVTAPNLTAWRRQTVGDLTAALGFSSPNDRRPSLPATALDAANGCPTTANLGPFLAPPEALHVPAVQAMPSQEPGTAKRRTP
jgi:phospholipase C